MSQETQQWLNENILVGFTEIRGNAWHYVDGTDNHYPQAVPVEAVRERLFHWEALEADLFFEAVDGKGKAQMRGADAKVIYRSDTLAPLGVHSQKWRCHSYDKWLIDNVSHILDVPLTSDSGTQILQIGSAGLLQRGAVAFVQVEAPDNIEGPNGEAYRPFIAATTSMNGTLASTYKAGVVRIVCDNTRNAFFSRSSEREYKIRHTVNSLGRIGDARDALGIIFKTSDLYVAEMETLMSQSVTDAQWAEFLTGYVPEPDDETKKRSVTLAANRRNALSDLYHSDPRVAPWQGSAWGVLQAVSTYQQHVRGNIHTNTNRVERNWLDFLHDRQEDEEAKALEVLAAVR